MSAAAVEDRVSGERLGEFRLSWTAYVAPIFMLLLAGAACAVVGLLSVSAGVILLAFSVAWFIYLVALRASTVLYADSEGVWLFSGIFPWARGAQGVRWADMDLAAYRPSFLSWAFRSFLVTVPQRYTKTNELAVGHVQGGDAAVALFNEALARFHRDR